MRHILTCPINPPSDKLYSHRGAQAAIYGSMIAERYGNCDINWGGKINDFSDYDCMWVYHGNDYTGSINMFGGMQGFAHVNNVVNFSQFKGDVYSLAWDMPDIGSDLKTRKERCKHEIKPEWAGLDFDNLERIYREAETVKHPNITNKLVIGDSHAIAMYRPGWCVNSVPFTTLNGALNRGLDSYIDVYTEELELYFGNIDIRHHVCRVGSGDYRENVEKLANRYIEAVKQLNIKASIYELMPIENESRQLPLSGQYKGQNFYGSWADRSAAREMFNDIIDDAGLLIKWTDYLLNDKGELGFEHMEKPRSVHLSRASYPHWS
jgi:hypothetical protein